MKILFLLILSFLSAPAFSQPEKGNVLLRGNLMFNSSSNTDQNAKSVNIRYGISPSVGYAFTDKLIGGISISFEGSTAYSSNMDGRSTTTSYSTGAFLKYYIPMNKERKLNFSPELYGFIGDASQKSISSMGTLHKQDIQFFETGIRPTLSYFLSQRWALELSIGSIRYESSRSVDKVNNPEEIRRIRKFGFDIQGSGIMLGLSYLIL